jgi:TolB-like protein
LSQFTNVVLRLFHFPLKRRQGIFAVWFSHNHWGLTRILTVIILLQFSCACSSVKSGTALEKIPRSERAGLAILNFKNTTAQERAMKFQPWEYGLAAMLTTDLEEIGIFNIVDRERLRDVLSEQVLQYSGLVDQKTAVRLGRLIAAQYILTGSFVEMNGELRIAAQIFSVEKGIQLGATSIVGETKHFFMVEKKLFVKIIGFMEVMLSEEERTKIVKAVETQSVDASLKNYSGEMAVAKAAELKKMGKREEAVRLLREAKEKFSEALEYDPNYTRAKKNLATLVMAIPLTL